MIKIEQKALSIGLFNPKIWLHYVDDIYCLLSDDDFDELDYILAQLNQIHPFINFTIEKEEHNTLPFLNVLCSSNQQGGFTTTVYRKPTHTNLYVRWDSAHPPSQKVGIFCTLLHQAKLICSTPLFYKQEEEFLFQTFLELGYPRDLLCKTILKFQHSSVAFSNPKEQTTDESKTYRTILSLPYVPNISERIGRAWKKCAKGLKNPIPYTIVLRPVRKLKSFLCKLYNKEPDGRCVYFAKCGTQNCPSSYIGETSLFLTSRRVGHKRPVSAIAEHCTQCGHDFERFSFDMIYREPENNRRQIAESLLIK
ncbi:MAG: hypothetical protein GY804_00055, partial [Alphaproteobacteria bacterium]|nr:hypothetical protein [Alphaproteobacteria bacterium]